MHAHLYVETKVDNLTCAIVQIDVQLIQREFLEEVADVPLQQILARFLLDIRRPVNPRHFVPREARLHVAESIRKKIPICRVHDKGSSWRSEHAIARHIPQQNK